MVTNKIISIQILRAVACLLVLQLHFIPFIPFTNQYFFGAIGVDLFFVISGYIIAASIYKLKDEKTPAKFLINRFTRVVPYYWVLTIGGFMFLYLLTKAHPFNLKMLINSLFFIPQVDVTLPMGWTLNHEVFFYLFVGLSSILFPKEKVNYIGFFFLAFLLSVQFLPSSSYVILFLKSSINYTFLFGFFTYFYGKRLLNLFNSNLLTLFTIVLFVFIISITCDFKMYPFQNNILSTPTYRRDIIYFQFAELKYGLPRVIIWGIPSFFLFLAIFAKEEYLKKYYNSILVKIGDASYSVYLLQFFVVVVFLYFKTTNLIFPLLAIFMTLFISLKMVKIENWIADLTKKLIYSFRKEKIK
jgi:exopolysaccharide production protein ExoZ